MISLRPKPRLPLQPQPKRLPERKAVTIAAGLVCYKGIVIAADGEVTHSVVKTQRVKMFECSPAEGIKVIGAGAGDELLIDNVKEKISEMLDVSVPDLVSIKRDIEKIIVDTLKDIWPLYDSKDRPELELLLGVRAADGLGLFQVSGPLVRDVPVFSCIGFGTDLAMYKAKYMTLSPLPAEIAAWIMVHVINVVKENVRYCGGESSIWMLHEDGRKEEMDSNRIHDLEKIYALYEIFLSAGLYLLPTLPGVEKNENLAEWLLACTEKFPVISLEENRANLFALILTEFSEKDAQERAFKSRDERQGS